jgi:mono/diheme cytochrome c family protein
MPQTLISIALAAALLAAAPAVAKERAGPGGRQLYLEDCARCHGVEGRGDGPDAPFFSPQPRDLTTGFVAKYTAAELVARVRDGEPLSLSVDPVGRAERAKRVESILGHMRKIPKVDWTAVDAGGLLYGQRCEVCHGQFGKPWPSAGLPEGVQAPPIDLRTSRFQESMSDAELIASFRHGEGTMPAVPPRLSKEQSRQMVAFLRLLSPGFETYSFYCAPCHGDDGRGRGYLPRDGEAPGVVFDEAYFAKADPDVLRAKVWHMMDAGGGGMPHFEGAASEERVRAIIEYLQSSQ